MKFPTKFTKILFVTLLILATFTIASPALAMRAPQEPVPPDPLGDLSTTLKTLGGVAALIPVLVSAGKMLGIVKDGTSKNWTAGLNLVALVGLFVLQIFGYANLVPAIDTQASGIANLLTAVLAFAGQILTSGVTYNSLRGSFLGFSFNS